MLRKTQMGLFTVAERISSRKAQVSRDRSSSLDWTLRYTGSDILDDVIADTASYFPAAVYEPSAGLYLVPNRWSYTPLGPGHSSGTAWASWDCVCNYCDPSKADNTHQMAVGETRIQASTTGGTARILVSLETVNKYAQPGETAPDFKNGINVTRDNEVKGVDKVVPACKFTVTTRLAQGTVTNAFFMTLEALTGTYNDAVWWGRPEGEVLFLGVDATAGSKSAPTLDFHFVRIPNITGLMIGQLGPITKLGHHYLWVLFEEKPEAGRKYMPAVPKAAYVERVYEPASFAALGLGTTAPAIPAWPVV